MYKYIGFINWPTRNSGLFVLLLGLFVTKTIFLKKMLSNILKGKTVSLQAHIYFPKKKLKQKIYVTLNIMFTTNCVAEFALTYALQTVFTPENFHLSSVVLHTTLFKRWFSEYLLVPLLMSVLAPVPERWSRLEGICPYKSH